MVATASPPLSPTPPLSHSATPASPRPWSPSNHDHLIFQWVKLEGKTQSWVASQLNINQATVSRAIQRYERWQAHAAVREGGRLDPQERLRAQRWLTYERNEQILASCLRIAHEMEGFTDVSKSTISHSASRPSQETEVRTQHATIDRTGMVARYLRLAFRINMEQLKLAELDPPPPAAPLTDDELAAFDRDADSLTQELLAARQSVVPSRREGPAAGDGIHSPATPPNDDLNLGTTPSGSPAPFDPAHPEQAEPMERPLHFADAQLPPTLNPEPETLNSVPPLHNLHNLHNENEPEVAATASKSCTCAQQPTPEKKSADTCIIDPQQFPWTIGSTSRSVCEPLVAAATVLT